MNYKLFFWYAFFGLLTYKFFFAQWYWKDCLQTILINFLIKSNKYRDFSNGSLTRGIVVLNKHQKVTMKGKKINWYWRASTCESKEHNISCSNWRRSWRKWIWKAMRFQHKEKCYGVEDFRTTAIWGLTQGENNIEDKCWDNLKCTLRCWYWDFTISNGMLLELQTTARECNLFILLLL